LIQRRTEVRPRSITPGFCDGGGNGKISTFSRSRLSSSTVPLGSNIRARVLVGEISVRSTGATRSGLIGKFSAE
jgi:hypothetical protein